MNDVTQGKTIAWKVVALLFAALLVAFGPAGCSGKPADEDRTDKLKSAPLAPGQNGIGKPQGSPDVKAVPGNGGKSGDEEDEEEPEPEPDDE
jgi:hypothetical protein